MMPYFIINQTAMTITAMTENEIHAPALLLLRLGLMILPPFFYCEKQTTYLTVIYYNNFLFFVKCYFYANSLLKKVHKKIRALFC